MAAEPFDLGDVRFERIVTRFHALGPRVLCEKLADLGARHLLRLAIEQAIAKYVDRLDPMMLAGVGGDRFPATPIRLVNTGDTQ